MEKRKLNQQSVKEDSQQLAEFFRTLQAIKLRLQDEGTQGSPVEQSPEGDPSRPVIPHRPKGR